MNTVIIRKQLSGYVLQKTFCQKFRKIHNKTLVLELLFLQKLQTYGVQLIKKDLMNRCFHVNFAKFLRASFSQITGVFRIMWNIYDGAFQQKQLTAFSLSLPFQKASSQMFNWVLNKPLQKTSGQLLLINHLCSLLFHHNILLGSQVPVFQPSTLSV